MLEPGDRAPEFTLPAAQGDGIVSLSDHLSRAAVLLALFRGLYCPFCRRQMAQVAHVADRLRPLGIEMIGVVATAADRARAYFRKFPTRLAFGTDPDLTTHRAYGLGSIRRTPEAAEMVEAAARQLALDLGVPVSPGSAREAIDRLDGYQPTEADRVDRERHQIQLTGQFLIDRTGIVRWSSGEDAARYASFPSEKELLAAAERLPR